jgi:hypothetical protein
MWRPLTKEQQAAAQVLWNADRDTNWSVDTAKGELVSNGKGVFLTTEKDYGDFEFYVDWLMVSPNGDSGVYLRDFPQVQVWDPDNPREVRNGAPRIGRALEQQPDNPGRWPLVRPTTRSASGTTSRSRWSARALGLAERQGHRGRPDPRQHLRPCPARAAAARSSSRRTARRSASATSTCEIPDRGQALAKFGDKQPSGPDQCAVKAVDLTRDASRGGAPAWPPEAARSARRADETGYVRLVGTLSGRSRPARRHAVVSAAPGLVELIQLSPTHAHRSLALPTCEVIPFAIYDTVDLPRSAGSLFQEEIDEWNEEHEALGDGGCPWL